MEENKHIPVLMEEVLYFLDVKENKIYVDATLGGGSHTRAILESNSSCKVIGLDWDKSVIESTGKILQQDFPGRFFPVWGNFSKVHDLVGKVGFKQVDGILADFGTSQIQISQTAGLSLYKDAFLDMRMSSAHFKVTAYDIIKSYKEEELADIFFQYGEERHSRRIAKKIVERRKQKPIKTTFELAELVKSVVPSKGRIHPATRVFQALRIVVNKELDNIHSFLNNSLSVLSDQARLVCISFHSLEDRIVKLFFKNQSERNNPGKHLSILTKKVCTASQEELDRNRSSRSAKLRAAIMKKSI